MHGCEGYPSHKSQSWFSSDPAAQSIHLVVPKLDIATHTKHINLALRFVPLILPHSVNKASQEEQQDQVLVNFKGLPEVGLTLGKGRDQYQADDPQHSLWIRQTTPALYQGLLSPPSSLFPLPQL